MLSTFVTPETRCWKSHSQAIIVVLILCCITGCKSGTQNDVLKKQAVARLRGELDKWISRQPNEAMHTALFVNVLLDYKIQSVRLIDSYGGSEESAANPTFLATVKAEYQSKANTPLTKVILYRVQYDSKTDAWSIRDTMTGN